MSSRSIPGYISVAVTTNPWGVVTLESELQITPGTKNLPKELMDS